MKKKKLLIILGIIMIIFVAIGMSYAYYIKSYSQENSNIVKTKCLNLSITNEKNDIKLDEQYPIPDSEGKKLTPYQFTITNTCEQFISYNVNLEALEGTTMDSNAIKVMVNNEAPVNLATLDVTQTSINNSVESRTLVTGSLGSGDSVDYALRLWMDYGDSADLSSMNKVFNSKVVVTATIGTYKPSDYVSTLHDAILVNEYGVTDVDNAIKKIEAKGTPDLSQTAPIITWKENTGDNSVRKVVKPDVSAINSDAQTSALGSEEYKMRVCTQKKFDIDSGKYTLSNCSLQDPTSLDYSGNTEYYYSTEFISLKSGVNKLYAAYNYSDVRVYKITGATKNESKTTWNKVLYDSITYNLNTLTLSSVELEIDKSDMGIYQAEDDFGTTYYYRGNVKNNNVYFAGMYWQIVRINGDGSIRIIYNGFINDENKTIGSTMFNTNYDKIGSVGYMYWDSISTDFNTIHDNVNSSTIKIKIDNWYKTNIKDKNYHVYLWNDVGFCGDRSLASNSVGNGVQNDKDTKFASFERYEIDSAIFTCPNIERDLYTAEDASIGNKALTYPVGLITYDELIFAGMNNKQINKLSWAYSTTHYWTITPSRYEAGMLISSVWRINSDGYVRSSWLSGSYGIRPVINLKADVEISGGIGTINDPYIIKTE